jgi:hypothetical protein
VQLAGPEWKMIFVPIFLRGGHDMTMFRTLAFSTMAVIASIGAAAAAPAANVNQFYSMYQPHVTRDHVSVHGAQAAHDYFSAYNRDLQGVPCGVECD